MIVLMLICIKFDAEGMLSMRTTITIDDELYRKALEVADPGTDKADIVREAMRVFVRVQSGKRLAALGSTAPDMKNIRRRRPVARAAR
jgi:Arc/MetJ family transcription regulator